MGSKTGISEARLKTIYLRQSNPMWDETYVPSILATAQEAPKISRAFILTPSKLCGRETHLLSTPERNVALLGLYHPGIIGLQEQRMLSPEPAVHPLWSMNGVDRTLLQPLKGVIDVAERLGYLDLLPRVKVKPPGVRDESLTVVFPWVGDLLWAIKSPVGAISCINWTAKSTQADFKRPWPRRDGRLRRIEGPRATLARHEIEHTYYDDARIRTVRVSDEDLDAHVAANLRQLFLHHRRFLGVTEEQRLEILRRYQVALETGVSPGEVITSFVERQRYSVDQCRSVLYQAIWFRQLRVDLFSPIFINQPLKPESRDALAVYGDWFRSA